MSFNITVNCFNNNNNNNNKAHSFVDFSGVRVIRSLALFVCFVDRCLYIFLLAIVLYALLQITDFDYLFGIFKLFLLIIEYIILFISYAKLTRIVKLLILKY